MHIEDILKNSEEVKKANSVLINEMYNLAGKELAEQIIRTLGNEDSAREWFYSSLRAFGWKRPYDYLKEGRILEIRNEIGRMKHGIIS